MSAVTDRRTELLVYEDREEGFHGYLAYCGHGAPLAAGGLRVQKGLRGETIVALAEAMALKERVLALNVDGAKCGIDYDAAAPGKDAALRRFLRFLRPHLRDRLSLGPDMGTAFGEIEALARQEDISSVKGAIAQAQGLPAEEVLRRLRLLDEPIGALTLGQRRAGHALAQATLVALRHVGALARRPTCALQGFGTLGRAAALALHEAGVRVAAIADEHGSVRCETGLDVARMLALPAGRPVAEQPCGGAAGERTAPFEHAADAVVLAACEDGLSALEAARLQAATVVVGANRGLSDAVEALLHERGIVVVPDFVGGAGGSAAMDALFAPAIAPTARAVLDETASVLGVLTDRVLARARSSGSPPRQAALALADERRLPPDAKPYGLRLLDGAVARHAVSW
ncbi:MAG: Glu/Leu/Phe/Val dehydrogenase [Actinobacteria bacterium]|nr:Glu/Leu/Phe/Val dehydrogenase [Actinomycetota bacterium]